MAIFFGILISYRGIPYAILIVLALGLLFTYISNNTVFGRQIYAIGGNAEAARLSGIDTRKRIFMLFVLMAALVAIAAFVLTARLGGASPLTGGGMELDAIAAGFIGGASVSGGIGTIPGALIGGLVMASIDNGMSLMDLTTRDSAHGQRLHPAARRPCRYHNAELPKKQIMTRLMRVPRPR